MGLLWDAVCLSEVYHFSPLKMPFANFSPLHSPMLRTGTWLQINEKSERTFVPHYELLI